MDYSKMAIETLNDVAGEVQQITAVLLKKISKALNRLKKYN